MEAGLPSWDALLDRLLLRGGKAAGLIEASANGDTDDDTRRTWLSQAGRDGPLGKAALAEALSGDERDEWIKAELFAPSVGPESFFPGPISRQIPALGDVFGDDLGVMTLNYDDLLEQAIRQHGGQPFALTTDDHRAPPGHTEVVHLHGYLGRDDRPMGQLILSEADYMQMQRGESWQEAAVKNALMGSTLVFVGTSMLDPNVVRYLHGVEPPKEDEPARFALFVRQGTYEKTVVADIRMARENALARRWEALGVRAIFLDHYTDVAQVLSEIARKRKLGDDYVSLGERAQKWITTVERDVLGWDDDTRFFGSQEGINGLLRGALVKACGEVESMIGHSWDETLQLALWLVSPEGGTLTNWVMTDRLHLDRRTIEPVPVDEYARWVAVRSYCLGTPLAESRDIYASRWKFVRGTPLVVDSDMHGRIPVGCLTTASMSPRSSTLLARMPGDVLAAFNDALTDTVLTLLDQPFQS